MTRTIISRLAGVSAVTLSTAAFAASVAGAATGSGRGVETAPLDWIERTVAAHPYGNGLVTEAGSQRERDTWFRDALGEAPAPDAVDRALAARARDTWFRDPVVETRIPDAVDRALAARARESLAAPQDTAGTVGAPALDSGSSFERPVLGALTALGFVALFAATLLVSSSVRRKRAQTA